MAHGRTEIIERGLTNISGEFKDVGFGFGFRHKNIGSLCRFLRRKSIPRELISVPNGPGVHHWHLMAGKKPFRCQTSTIKNEAPRFKSLASLTDDHCHPHFGMEKDPLRIGNTQAHTAMRAWLFAQLVGF